MDYELSSKLQGELQRGERLLWAGRPRQGLVLRGVDGFLIPFSLFWGGFAVFWEFMALTSDAPAIMPIFGAPFVAIGLYLIVGRFFVDAYQRGRTVYGVTSERVLVLGEAGGRKLTSIDLADVSEVMLTTRKDGSGTISFGAQLPFGQVGRGATLPGLGPMLGPFFDLVPDAAAVHRIIVDARRRLREE